MPFCSSASLHQSASYPRSASLHLALGKSSSKAAAPTIADLPGRDEEAQRAAAGIGDGVQFRVHAAFGPPDQTPETPFFTPRLEAGRARVHRLPHARRREGRAADGKAQRRGKAGGAEARCEGHHTCERRGGGQMVLIGAADIACGSTGATPIARAAATVSGARPPIPPIKPNVRNPATRRPVSKVLCAHPLCVPISNPMAMAASSGR